MQVKAADGAAGVRLMLMGDTVDRADHLGSAHQGILAQVHGRRARMRLDAGEGQVEPLLAQAAHHNPQGNRLVLQHRALLDMRLEISAHRMAQHRTRTGIADALQFAAYRQALVVALVEGVLQVELPGKYPGAHHARREARAFFVGPHHHFQRRLGFHLEVVEGAQHFHTGQHAEATVELAAGGLGVDMAAGHHRWQVGIAPRTTGENVADAIHGHGAAGLFAPLHEQVAGLAIQVGKGQATHTALGRGAELGQVHQRLPQAVAVDLQDVEGSIHG